MTIFRPGDIVMYVNDSKLYEVIELTNSLAVIRSTTNSAIEIHTTVDHLIEVLGDDEDIF